MNHPNENIDYDNIFIDMNTFNTVIFHFSNEIALFVGL